MCLSDVNIFALVGMLPRAEPEIKTWFGVVSLESNPKKQQRKWGQWGREGGHFNGGMLWSFAVELLCWQRDLNLARTSKRRKGKEREKKGKERKKKKRERKRKKDKEFNWKHYKLFSCLVLVKLIFTMYLLHHLLRFPHLQGENQPIRVAYMLWWPILHPWERILRFSYTCQTMFV